VEEECWLPQDVPDWRIKGSLNYYGYGTVFNQSLDKFLLLKMKPVAVGENGVSTKINLMQMDHCVRIAWEFFSGWIPVV